MRPQQCSAPAPAPERCQNGEEQAGVTSVQDPGLGGRASAECRLTKALRNNDCDIEGTNITILRDPPPRRPPPPLSSGTTFLCRGGGSAAVRLPRLPSTAKLQLRRSRRPARHPIVASRLPSLAEPSLSMRLPLSLAHARAHVTKAEAKLWTRRLLYPKTKIGDHVNFGRAVASSNKINKQQNHVCGRPGVCSEKLARPLRRKVCRSNPRPPGLPQPLKSARPSGFRSP